jgi:hypothetical protein
VKVRALAAVALVVLATGCDRDEAPAKGSGGPGLLHTTTGASAGTTRAPNARVAFAARADAICVRYLEQGAANPAASSARLLARQTAELGALPVPAGEAEEVAMWLSRQRRLVRAVNRGVPGAGGSEQASRNLTEELKRESLALGMHKCFVVSLGATAG